MQTDPRRPYIRAIWLKKAQARGLRKSVILGKPKVQVGSPY